MGAVGKAEWRVEIEALPPYNCDNITQALFLHHLIRQLATNGFPRGQFAMLYKKHLQSSSPEPVTGFDLFFRRSESVVINDTVHWLLWSYRTAMQHSKPISNTAPTARHRRKQTVAFACFTFLHHEMHGVTQNERCAKASGT